MRSIKAGVCTTQPDLAHDNMVMGLFHLIMAVVNGLLRVAWPAKGSPVGSLRQLLALVMHSATKPNPKQDLAQILRALRAVLALVDLIIKNNMYDSFFLFNMIHSGFPFFTPPAAWR